MRRALGAVVAVAAVVLLAGCGGGKSAAPPVKPAVDRPAELQRYLDRMEQQERRFDALLGRVTASFAPVDAAKPGPAWTRAANRLASAGQGLNRLGVEIGKLHAPKRLLRVHRRLAASTLSFGGYVTTVEQALRVRIPATLATAARTDTTEIKQARVAWVKAVERYCFDLGLAPPEWMVPSPAG
jgi:hypothetical protein